MMASSRGRGRSLSREEIMRLLEESEPDESDAGDSNSDNDVDHISEASYEDDIESVSDIDHAEQSPLRSTESVNGVMEHDDGNGPAGIGRKGRGIPRIGRYRIKY